METEAAAEAAVDGIPPVEDVELTEPSAEGAEVEAGEEGAAEGEAAQETPAEEQAADPHEATRLELERKDREQHEAAVALKAQQHELDAFRELRRRITGTPDEQRAALKTIGFDAAAATELALGGTPEPEAPDPSKETEALKERIDELEKGKAEAAHQQNVDAELTRLQGVIEADPDKFGVLASLGKAGANMVYERVLSHVKERNSRGIQGELAMPDQHKFAEILTETETAAKTNVLTSLDDLLKNKFIEGELRTRLGVPGNGAATTKPAEAGAPGKAITPDLAGEPNTEERIITPEQAEKDALEMINKAITDGTL